MDNSSKTGARKRTGTIAAQSQRPTVKASPASGRDDKTTSGGVEPPFTNRGVFNTNDQIQMSIHWLDITFFSTPRKPMTDFMSIYLPWHLDDDYQWEDDFTLRGSTGRFYKAIYDGPDGIVLYAYPEGGTYCSLQISGSAIEKMGQDMLFRMLELFQSKFTRDKKNGEVKYHWQSTRIDIAFDGVPFSPAACREAWLAGNIRTRSHPDSYDWRSNAEGDTFYAGKRVSGRYLRVYNRRGPVRLEIELKKKYAMPFVSNLMEDGFVTLRDASLGVLRDMVDFIDLDSNKNKSRATLLPWWQALVGEADRIRYSKISRDETASAEEHRLTNFFNRMKPTLFMFGEILGHDLNETARLAATNLKPHHRAKVLRLRPDYRIIDG